MVMVLLMRIVHFIIIISNPCGYLKCFVHKTREKTKKKVEKLKKLTKRKDKKRESSSSSDDKKRENSIEKPFFDIDN